VNEGDVKALSAFAGSLVENATVLVLNLLESVSHTILNAESDVLDAATATVLLNELSDSAVGAGSLKKLNLGLTNFEESGAYVLVLYLFDCEAFETEKFLIKRYSLIKACDCYTNMFDV
jgi:hypothetical protein